MLDNVNFLVIGSQRCGTTWIHQLMVNLGIRLPVNKQTYFFDRNYKKGMDWYWNQFPPEDLSLSVGSPKIVGEIATGYCLPNAFNRMVQQFPNTKLILVVRDPIDRALSNFKKRKSEYGNLSFQKAILSDADLLERGMYGEMIDRMITNYDERNIKILFYEDLCSNPTEFARDIINFLEIDVSVSLLGSALPGRVNSSRFSGYAQFLKRIGLDPLVKYLRKKGIKRRIERLPIFSDRKPKDLRVALTAHQHDRLSQSNNLLLKNTGRSYEMERLYICE